MIPKLGKVKRVDVRSAWMNEATHFTPWLASEEGMELLQETLGMELEVEATEKFVGPFKADILAKRTDTTDDHWVLIENQLERTDHRHLGQLLTYAAGLDAVTIVWIAQSFAEEHRAALDWLNDITGEGLEFFGLEIELWQIEGSPPAPMFNLVAEPNEWTKEIKQETATGVSDPMHPLAISAFTTFAPAGSSRQICPSFAWAGVDRAAPNSVNAAISPLVRRFIEGLPWFTALAIWHRPRGASHRWGWGHSPNLLAAG